MSRWFRFYDDAVHDPKLLKLSDGTFRMWVMLLCVASKEKGTLPSTEDLGFYLRVKPARVAALIAELVAAGLLDKTGNGFSPHNWAGRQYQSDGSAERVKRHREKRAAAGLQAQWTPPKALRQAVYDRDGHKCVYCGSGERLSLDHKTPEIRGGTHDIENLATACISCNGAKRDMTETEYRDAVTLLKRPQRTEQNTEQSRADTRDDSQKLLGDFRQAIVQTYAQANSPTLPDTARAGLWLTQGFDPEICLAVIASIVPKKPNAGLAYFESAIAEAHQKKAPPRKPLTSGPPPKDWDMAAKLWSTNKRWPREHGNDPDSPSCQAPPDILRKYGIEPISTQ